MSIQTSLVRPAPPVRSYVATADLAIAQGADHEANDRFAIVASPKDLRSEPAPVRFIIIALAVTFLTVFVVLPLVVVFAQAFSKGISAYLTALSEPEALSAVRLTLLVAAISVSLNLVFGVIAAWAIAKFDFRGKTFLISLIDLPFSVSPVISGWSSCCCSARRDTSAPGCRRTTSTSCSPCRHRAGDDLRDVPVRRPCTDPLDAGAGHAGGGSRDLARRVRSADLLPRHSANIKWGLLYGVLLCNARAMGEFGAVSVVSGHIRGETNTMPLLVEILYNEYQFVASFAIASLLAMLALITLVVKTILERRLDEGQFPRDH